MSADTARGEGGIMRAGLVAPPAPGSIFKSYKDCPDAKRHDDGPEGYLAWHAWAEEKQKRYRCEQCPTCGFWTIWKPKK